MSRLLIVEDHPNLLRSMRRGLELLGHEVLTAETGEEGYALAIQHDVELVVLDLMLPGKNGFEILRDLRQARFDKPVLVQTAKHSREDLERVQQYGAIGLLLKPFAFADLVTRINELLEQAVARASTVESPPCAD